MARKRSSSQVISKRSSRRRRVDEARDSSEDESNGNENNDANNVVAYEDTSNENMALDYAKKFEKVFSTEIELEPVNKTPAEVLKMSECTQDEMTAKMVRYVLYKAHANLPIKFADLKEVFPRYKSIGRYFLDRALVPLKNVFGYRVVGVKDNKKICFVLNNVNSTGHLRNIGNPASAAIRGFLMTVLGAIWCSSGRRMDDETLWTRLRSIDHNLYAKNSKHPELGDVSAVMKSFETQMYLSSASETNNDGQKLRYYSYGDRTHVEISIAQILHFVHKVNFDREPDAVMLQELRHEVDVSSDEEDE